MIVVHVRLLQVVVHRGRMVGMVVVVVVPVAKATAAAAPVLMRATHVVPDVMM